MSKPGAVPDRQDKSHPHQVIVDPTDSFIVVPDLGADLLRVYSICHDTSSLTEVTNVATPPGSGPRHGAFHTTEYGDTFFYIHTEISNKVITYKVTYSGSKSLSFNEVSSIGTFGKKPTPEGAAAGEALISVSTYLSSPESSPAHPSSLAPQSKAKQNDLISQRKAIKPRKEMKTTH